MAKVIIPSALRKKIAQSELNLEGQSLNDVLSQLTTAYPFLTDYLFDENGRLSSFVNFYINGQDIRYLKLEETQLSNDDEIHIIPAISGG